MKIVHDINFAFDYRYIFLSLSISSTTFVFVRFWSSIKLYLHCFTTKLMLRLCVNKTCFLFNKKERINTFTEISKLISSIIMWIPIVKSRFALSTELKVPILSSEFYFGFQMMQVHKPSHNDQDLLQVA